MASPGLEFDEASHVYKLNGRETPSVTTVLQPYSGLQFVDPEILEAAADLGTKVHKACHLFNMGVLNRDTLDPIIEPYVAAWELFLKQTGAVIIQSEKRVYSKKRGFAGTLDTVLYWGKTNRLCDIKTGSSVPRSVGPQTAAYKAALMEMGEGRIDKRHCIHLKPDGTYQSHALADPRDLDIFYAILTAHRWANRLD